jgi:hypothetical protein
VRRRGCRHCHAFTVAVAYDSAAKTIHDELGISECMPTDDGAMVADETPRRYLLTLRQRPPARRRCRQRHRHGAQMALPQPVTVKQVAGRQRRSKTLRRYGTRS